MRLEALLDHWFRGPWFNDLEASPGIERKIAAFFEVPGLPEVRRLALLDLDGESPFEQRARETFEATAFIRGAAETVMEVAEVFGQATHVYRPKRM